MAQFFAYLKLIIEFWGIIKPLLDRLKVTPQEERQRVANAILEASNLADSGDTTAYESEISKGRMNE